MEEKMKITLKDQIATMEISIANHRGYTDNLRHLVKKKQREQIWLDIAEDRYPKLQAVLKTLKWLEKNEEKIKIYL
jgi:hypothetical protein